MQPRRQPKHTHPHRTPEPRTAGYIGSAHTTTHPPEPRPKMEENRPKPKPNCKHRETQTQTQAPSKSRKSSGHSPDTEAARAMQVTRPNEIRSPGVRLHPKACAALQFEAERATPKRLGNPSTKNMHACLGKGIRQDVR